MVWFACGLIKNRIVGAVVLLYVDIQCMYVFIYMLYDLFNVCMYVSMEGSLCAYVPTIRFLDFKFMCVCMYVCMYVCIIVYYMLAIS